MIVTEKLAPEVLGEVIVLHVKVLGSSSVTEMVAVPLDAPEALAVMTAFCAPSASVSFAIVSVKLAEVEPAGMVTVEDAGVASVVSFEARFTTSALARALGMDTVPVTLPADSAAEAGSVTVRGRLTLKVLEMPAMAPLAAWSTMFRACVGIVTFPVHTPALKAPVVAGDGVAVEAEPKRMSGRVALR